MASTKNAPARHDDLSVLRRKQVRIPEVFRHGSWITVPVGHRSEPSLGPSGTQLLLWLPVETPVPALHESSESLTWSQVEKAIGAPRGPASRSAPADAIGALLQGEAGLGRIVAGNQWLVRGTEYPTEGFGNSFWKHGWAIGTHAGLLVSLIND